MNRLVIIGNGFDLAHDLKTSYSDFMFWYFKRIINYFIESRAYNGIYEDKLVKFLAADSNSLLENHERLSSASDLRLILVSFKKYGITDFAKGKFFKEIIDTAYDLNWVNVESIYYRHLKKSFQNFLRIENGNREVSERLVGIRLLNEQFECLRDLLIEYLTSINEEVKKVKLDNSLDKVFFGALDCELQDRYRKKDHLGKESREIYSTYFLNFNYTNLIGRYADYFRPHERLVIKHIHGQLQDKLNPVVFGYGDHFDKIYPEIESCNENDFLKHIKYFNYLSTEYYQSVMNFIHADRFQVVVIGHSLGVSDRTMLKRIFEDDNCVSIKMYCYQDNHGGHDFNQKMMEISRHFDNKAEMLQKVVRFNPNLIFKVNKDEILTTKGL